jgi:hypothetical protein
MIGFKNRKIFLIEMTVVRIARMQGEYQGEISAVRVQQL